MNNPIKTLLLFSSGAKNDVLKACKDKGYNEDNKFLTVGLTVLLTGIFAAIAGGYAIFRVFLDNNNGLWYAISFACLWGLMIYNLDRFIVQGIDKTRPWWRQLLISIPRIILAVIISIVISKPLEVKLFSDRLAYEIGQSKIEADSLNRIQINGNYDIHNKTTERFEARAKYQEAKEKAAGIPNSSEYLSLKDDHKECITVLQELKNRNYPRIGEIRNELRLIENDPSNYSILDGNKDFYIGAQERIDRLSVEKSRLNRIVRLKREECEETEENIDKIEFEYKKLWGEKSIELEKDKVEKEDSYNEASNKAGIDIGKQKQIASRSFNQNFISQLEALGRLTNEDRTFELINLFVILLFILVETAPVFVKLFQAVDMYDEELAMRKKKYKFKNDKDFEAFKRDEEEAFKIETLANERILAKIADAQVEIAESVIEKWKISEIDKRESTPYF